jgi:hypothetical protein
LKISVDKNHLWFCWFSLIIDCKSLIIIKSFDYIFGSIKFIKKYFEYLYYFQQDEFTFDKIFLEFLLVIIILNYKEAGVLKNKLIDLNF